jgi:peptide/nickel transport system substrate-binding protein
MARVEHPGTGEGERRITRRQFTGRTALAGIAAAGFGLIGCGGSDDDKSTNQAPAITPANASTRVVADQDVDTNATLTVGYGSFPPSLDPTTAGGQGGQSANNSYHFDYLFDFNKSLQTIPEGLATYKYINDNTVFRITANKGITFHNGEPLNAECIKFYFDRLLGRAAYNPKFTGVQKTRIDKWMGDISIVDEMTVDIKLTSPFVFAPENTGGLNFDFTPRQYIIENGDEAFARKPVGTGPMMFESFTPDQELRSIRNDKYPFPRDYKNNKRLPWVARIVGRSIPEEQARIAALEKGEIDIAYRVGPDSAKPFNGRQGYNVVILPDTRIMAIELPLNASKDPKTGGANPWRDVRVRRAANYAIDVDAIVKNLLTGREQKAYAPFPSGYPLPVGNLGKPYSFDPARARALLKEAGAEGFAFDLTLPTGLWTGDRTWMPAIGQMLNDVGFKANIVYQDFGNALTAIQKRQIPGPFVFNQGSIAAGRSDPGFSWGIIATSGAAYTHAQKGDDFLPEQVRLDALVAQANGEFDEKKRNDLYQQVATLHYENAFAVYLFNLSHVYVTRGNIVYNEYYDTPTGMSLQHVKKLRT